MNHTIRSLPHSICRALSRLSAGLLAAALLPVAAAPLSAGALLTAGTLILRRRRS